MRPTLLYASPLPPEQSGIADYSAALLPALAERYDITLMAKHGSSLPAALRERFPIQPDARGEFDRTLLHLGNSPPHHDTILAEFRRRPAPVLLHDVVLFFLIAGLEGERPDFLAQVAAHSGPRAIAALRPWLRSGGDVRAFPQPERVPLNEEIIDRAPLLLVHSEFALRAIRAHRPSALVVRLPMIDMTADQTPDRDAAAALLHQRLSIDPGAFVVASFGFIIPTKQNQVVAEAVLELDRPGGRPVIYVMAGVGASADSLIGPRVRKTGWLPPDLYAALLARADLVANLRYPSMGESSIALVSAMAAGRACLVSDLGSYAELPADVVCRLPARPLEARAAVRAAIERAMTDPAWTRELGERARRHVRQYHAPGVVARELSAALESFAGFQPTTA